MSDVESALLKLFMEALADTENYSEEEMDKLENLLKEAEIPYERFKHFTGSQLCYYGPNGRPSYKKENVVWAGPGVGAICSVIISSGSYGGKEGLLEISGLMTKEEYEEKGNTVLGYLTAENVFQRIKKHYMETKQ